MPMQLPAAVDDYVSSASPVRAIDAFVDGLDLPALGFRTRDDFSEGRSSYHPGSLLKLYLWGYLRRTRSSRSLENACAENLQAIWLTGNLRPDHSTISDFRKNHTAALKGILHEFNLICFSLRLFGRELVAIVGTFIKAVNSSDRSFTQAKLAKLIEAIDQAATRYLDELQQAVIVRSRQRLAADPTAMRKRASLVEHPFSTIKDRHGYTGLLCKGIKQATAEINLSAWAYNFTRVVNLVGLDEMLEAIQPKNAAPLA